MLFLLKEVHFYHLGDAMAKDLVKLSEVVALSETQITETQEVMRALADEQKMR
jgi:hypothetical protein